MDTSSRVLPVPLPCLALRDRVDSDKPVTLFSMVEKKTIACEEMAKLMKNSSVFATQQGWMVVHDATTSMSTFLLDPLNFGHRIQLPHLPKTLSSPSPLCCGTVTSETRSGRGTSTTLGRTPCFYEDKTVDEKLPICPIAACQGKFFFNGTAKELAVLEFCPEPVFSKIAISDVIDGFFGYMNCAHIYLVEADDELYLACTLFGFDLKTIYEVRVYQMDFSRQRWSRVEELGDRAFLVSPWYFGACYSAEKHGLEPNCVYLACPRENEQCQCYKIYNIKDGTSKVNNIDE
uniref:KIB1-4 beta-propeller domain-containing protein n=1 Tax=Oryza brachyantha TaxID=4533 RepID=J3LFC4_ORYBR